MPVNVIVGLQRGDEGKGRFVDMLAEDHDIVARFNGGNNAGHTIAIPDGRELALHQIPSGIVHPDVLNVIGNGTLVNPVKLSEEIDDIRSKDFAVDPRNLMISSSAHLILPHHIYDDKLREAGQGKQGSTKSGIAQVSSSKVERIGARVESIKNDPQGLYDLVLQGLVSQRSRRQEAGTEVIDEEEVAKEYIYEAKKLGMYVTDTVLFLNRELRQDKPAQVLAEGAQAFLLDIDHGMYPYTTSTSTTSGGACIGLGVAPAFINRVSGIAKAIQSHVGEGPFVTEIHDEDTLNRLHGDMTTIDAEKGTTTQRVRRLGFLDLPQIRRSLMVNGMLGQQEIALTKLDWVPRFGDEVDICTSYFRKGRQIDIAPDAAYKLVQATALYQKLPTWDEDIKDIRDYKDLPYNARNYIDFIETQTQTPITMIGVGPRRDQVIDRRV